MWQRFLRNGKVKWVSAAFVSWLLLLLIVRYYIFSWPVLPVFRDYIVIPEGASAYRVAHLLVEKGILDEHDQEVFVNAVRLKSRTRSIKPGKFQLLNVKKMIDLVDQILNPKVGVVIVTIPEGARRTDIAQFFGVKYPIDYDNFMALTGDSAFMAHLGIQAPHLEGYLFPDTYRIMNGSTEESIIAQMVQLTLNALDNEIIAQGREFGLASHDILTMASIIEGETKYDREKRLISAVYHNRLKRGMRLQADPTVQYAISDGPRRLYYRDYKYASDYNTYLHKGLPPTPINSPGYASIIAAVNPEKVDYLYFVANGEGQHVFTRSFTEHKEVINDIRQ